MDNFDRGLALLVVCIGLCIAGYVLAAQSVVANCKKTTDFRTTTTYVMSGKILVPVVSTQYRYICPDGSDAWL
jgi:hypothetical protein